MIPDASRPQLVLDRVEGEVAVLLLEEREIRLPRAWLPHDAVEGDLLRLEFSVDQEATRRSRERVAQKRQGLTKKDDGGDFSL
jgi:hypothetical protein